jgi:hypothetical protein
MALTVGSEGFMQVTRLLPGVLWAFLAVAATAVVGGCKGCMEPPAVEEPGEQRGSEPIAVLEGGKPLLLENRLFLLSGEIDLKNSYQSAVMVTVGDSEESRMRCSGAAVSRRAVLTAGHCVCARRKREPSIAGESAFIDTAKCSRTATVETVLYERRIEGGVELKASRGKVHEGTVRPHPALMIVLDEQGHVVSARADLALIVLREPMEVQPAAVTDAEVRIGDSVIIVGYGYDEIADAFGHDRRSNVNKAVRVLAPGNERILVEQPGKHLYRSDSGGPCFLGKPAGLALVGISSRWLGEGATFTSIYDYRGWLREEIHRAESEPLDER